MGNFLRMVSKLTHAPLHRLLSKLGLASRAQAVQLVMTSSHRPGRSGRPHLECDGVLCEGVVTLV